MNKAQLHCFLFMCFYITLYSDKSRKIFLAEVAKWLIFQQINEYAGKKNHLFAERGHEFPLRECITLNTVSTP